VFMFCRGLTAIEVSNMMKWLLHAVAIMRGVCIGGSGVLKGKEAVAVFMQVWQMLKKVTSTVLAQWSQPLWREVAKRPEVL
jgi:hypothetical protein